ncbi:RNA-directed DNA polymerase [Gardnerella sp. DNF00476]|uniref:RNA-directed DNA polymerase n=1 Tax=Gardnerella sp. DNF00476 TaxID=2749047 RepID=UPI003BAF2D3D
MSIKRVEARYKRRQIKRQHNRAAQTKTATFENTSSLQSLTDAAYEACKTIKWKNSVQQYMNSAMLNTLRAHKLMTNNGKITGLRKCFTIMERGKVRHIQSSTFWEKVIQKSIARNVLIPCYTRSYTHGNSANQRGRGEMYAIKLLRKQLARHYRKHGSQGWILLCDYSNYFASIPREKVLQQASERIQDARIMPWLEQLMNAECDSGLGLGAETNQQLAVGYVSRIDHWIEECSGCEATGRYMDDLYVIDSDLLKLRSTLDEIKEMSAELGLTLNSTKTYITSLHHGFTLLKKKWYYTQTGRIITRPIPKTIKRMRRHLRALTRLADRGEISWKQITAMYHSWRGTLKHYNAWRTIQSMDAYYKQLKAKNKTL